MCEVTIVIPNYNGEEFLRPCLKAIYKYTKIETEILVVDNGSKDGSIERAKSEYPQVKYLLLNKNYGFCKAVNDGIKNSMTPYVILLNNDTRIFPGFVENLLKAIKYSKRIFSVEGKMIQYNNPDLIDSAGTFYNAFGWAFARGKDKSVRLYNRRCKVFAACAGAAIYRKNVFDKIGYFDERHFAYLEDIDIGYRAKIFGYENFYEPEAKVLHFGSGASGSRYNLFKIKLSARNNIYLIYKNMPALQIILNFPFLLIGFICKLCFFYKKGFGLNYLYGIKEGVKMCTNTSMSRIQYKNITHYIKIQIELWGNIIRRFNLF